MHDCVTNIIKKNYFFIQFKQIRELFIWIQFLHANDLHSSHMHVVFLSSFLGQIVHLPYFLLDSALFCSLQKQIIKNIYLFITLL